VWEIVGIAPLILHLVPADRQFLAHAALSRGTSPQQLPGGPKARADAAQTRKPVSRSIILNQTVQTAVAIVSS